MFIPLITKIQQALLQLTSPPYCMYCKVFLPAQTIFCDRCYHAITPIASASVGVREQLAMPVFAVSAYKDPIKKLILAKKWSHIIASKYLGELIWNHTHLSTIPFDILVPIPLHWTRYMKRGYNQAHEIACILSKKSGKPVVPLLNRTRRTLYQSLLSARERKQNVCGVFSTSFDAQYADKHIMLVDDLMTTGATLQAAAKALLVCKPAKISAVVAARVV